MRCSIIVFSGLGALVTIDHFQLAQQHHKWVSAVDLVAKDHLWRHYLCGYLQGWNTREADRDPYPMGSTAALLPQHSRGSTLRQYPRWMERERVARARYLLAIGLDQDWRPAEF